MPPHQAPRRAGRPPRPGRRRGLAATGGLVLVSLLCLLLTGTDASFRVTSISAASFTAAQVAAWDPQSVSAVRTDPTTCTVTWTPAHHRRPG